MTKKKKKFTLAQVLDAIELNGYKKAKGNLYRNRKADFKNNFELNLNKRPISACAVGQGAINLDVSPKDLADALSVIKIPNSGFYGGAKSVYNIIYRMNDNTTAKVSTIAAKARAAIPEEYLSQEIELPTVVYAWKKEGATND